MCRSKYINETCFLQVSLVTNAQDGLRQALELYEKASSKVRDSFFF